MSGGVRTQSIYRSSCVTLSIAIPLRDDTSNDKDAYWVQMAMFTHGKDALLSIFANGRSFRCFSHRLSTHHKAIKHVFIIELIEIFEKQTVCGDYHADPASIKSQRIGSPERGSKKNLVVFIEQPARWWIFESLINEWAWEWDGVRVIYFGVWNERVHQPIANSYHDQWIRCWTHSKWVMDWHR